MNLIKAVNAALVCAAKKDIRYYLNGVALYLKNNEVVAVAGNNRYMGVVVGSLDDYDETIIVDRSYCKLLLELLKEEGNEIRNDFPNVTVNGVSVPQIDGRYPDIRRVIPAKKRNVNIDYGIGLNPEFLANVHKVKQALTKGMTTREKNTHQSVFSFGSANESVRVDFNSLDTVLMIMPARL